MTVENATTETMKALPGDVRTMIAGTAGVTNAETITGEMTISPNVLGTAMAIPREETETTILETGDTTDGKEVHMIGRDTAADGHQTGTVIESAGAVEAAAQKVGSRGMTEIDLVRLAAGMSDKTAGVEVL